MSEMEDNPSIQTFNRWTVPVLQKYLRDRDLSLPTIKSELVAMAFAATVLKLPLAKTAEEKLKERAIQYESLLCVGDLRLPDPMDSELSDGWVGEDKGHDLWPPTMYFDICNYLFAKVGQQRRDLRQRLMTDYKEGKAYSYFSSGWVQEVFYHEVSQNSDYCFLKSEVTPSMRVNDEPHKAWIAIEKKTGAVQSAYCTCFAGLGETCNHIAAILFKVDHAWQWGVNNKACTSKPCMWKEPTSKKVAVQPKPLAAMLIKKPHYSHGGKNVPINHSKRQLFKVVKKSRTATLNNLMGALSISCPNASVFQNVDIDTCPNYKPSDDVNVSCTLDVTTSEVVQPPKTLTEAARAVNSTEALVSKLVYPVEAVEKLAQLTTGQADNPLWFEHREGRITGSKMHAVHTKMNSISSKGNDCINADTLVASIMGYTKVSDNIPALKYGRAMEDEARRRYVKETMARHKNLTVKPSGLHVCASKGYIGASPDGLVSCDCCGQGLLEIKCPYSIAHDAPSTSNLAYIKEGKLSQTHAYYTQVQGQLAITDRQWCDFFVFTKHGHYLERVLFCQDYWTSISTNLEKFFVRYIAPELLSGDIKKSSAVPLEAPAKITPAPAKFPLRNPPQIQKKKARTTRRKPTIKPVYICGSCETVCKDAKDITDDSDFTIGCDMCKKWFHWSCAGYDGGACDTWHCGDCCGLPRSDV